MFLLPKLHAPKNCRFDKNASHLVRVFDAFGELLVTLRRTTLLKGSFTFEGNILQDGRCHSIILYQNGKVLSRGFFGVDNITQNVEVGTALTIKLGEPKYDRQSSS